MHPEVSLLDCFAQVTGSPHCQDFTIEAAFVLGDWRLTARGQGASKKSAKEEAARNTLREIDRSRSSFSPEDNRESKKTENAREQAEFIEEKMRQLEKLKEEIEKEQSKYSELRKKTGQLSERMIIRRSTSPVFPTTVWVICRSSAWQEAWGPRNNEVAAPLMFSIQCGLGTEATTVDGPNKVHNLRRDVIFCH